MTSCTPLLPLLPLLACSPRDPDSDEVPERADSASQADDTAIPSEGQVLDLPPAPVTTGPIVGAVTHEAATIMVRMKTATSVRFQLSATASFDDDPITTQPSTALEHNDYTVRIRVEGLQPDTRYHYRVLAGEHEQSLDRAALFRTAPDPAAPASFSFGLLADASTNNERLAPAYDSLAAHDPAFVVQIGDLDHRDPGAMEKVEIENWRQMHRDQLKNYQAGQILDAHLLCCHPFFHTWDDHDYGVNNAGMAMPGKDMAKQAFFEYFPLPPDLPNPEAGIWYAFRWAQAEVFMLDVRSQRDTGPMDPEERSMLAAATIENDQKTWLKTRLLESEAAWKFIVSPSCWNPDSKRTDSWNVYPAEREELLAFMRDNHITGVVVLTGDIHSGGAIDDGSHSGIPELSVPTSNIHAETCTGGLCGDWSEGIWDGNGPEGYAMVHLRWEQERHSVELATYDERGGLRSSLVLEPDQASISGPPGRR